MPMFYFIFKEKHLKSIFIWFTKSCRFRRESIETSLKFLWAIDTMQHFIKYNNISFNSCIQSWFFFNFIKVLLTKWKEFTKRCQFMFRSFFIYARFKSNNTRFLWHTIKSTFFLPLSCIVARTEIALQTLHLLIKISLRQEMRHCYAWYFLMCTNKPPVRKRITVRKNIPLDDLVFLFFSKQMMSLTVLIFFITVFKSEAQKMESCYKIGKWFQLLWKKMKIKGNSIFLHPVISLSIKAIHDSKQLKHINEMMLYMSHIK
jgi:hypothetical protein